MLGGLIGDVFEGAFADEAELFEELIGVDLGGGNVGAEAGSPEDLVGHPVADSGERGLVEEKGFDGEFWVSGEDCAEVFLGEGGGVRFGRKIRPGSGVAFVEQ